ncbi:MAG: alpha/beta hydrolase [Lachnospiraceae bacterium]|jgi:fermentation-respiration switch protein FrsA (DUF1100 family)
MKNEELNLTQEWDKTFAKSEKVDHRKVTFHNRYGITLAADLYTPKNVSGKLPAIAVCGAFGMVKEMASGRYAQAMAERGFLTIAFDPSFTGESGGFPRNIASPDINTEDFQAAVDFLSVQRNADPDKISIIGICGWGGMALAATIADTRIRATITSTMYDMSRQIANGYYDAEDSEEKRHEKKVALNAQRTEDYRTGEYRLAGGLPAPEDLPADTPDFVRNYSLFYKTKLGYHPRSVAGNDGWTVTGTESFMDFPLLTHINEIRTPVLMIHGEKAHSLYFSKDAFAAMTKDSRYADNKELMIIPGAVHTDLYYRMDVIPFDKMAAFIRRAIGE